MKKLTTLIILMMVGTLLAAQPEESSFYSRSSSINSTGMMVLGGWAITNIGLGAVGWARNTGTSMYFNQMNLFWNIVNLGIAGVAFYGSYSPDISTLTGGEMLAKHLKTENLYLINGGLDIIYIGTGLLLRHLSQAGRNRPEMLMGYGNAMVLQGSFLMLFDLAMYGIQRTVRMQFLEGIQLSFLPGSLALQVAF